MKIATFLIVATAFLLGNASVFASPISIPDGQFPVGNHTAMREESWTWESRDFNPIDLNPQVSFVIGVQAAPAVLRSDATNYGATHIRSDQRQDASVATVVVPERFPLWLGILAGGFSLWAFTRKMRVTRLWT